jgi:hypothetical protein
MDLGFGADDLGITILEEIHNCIKCGEAISHPDYQVPHLLSYCHS